MSTIYVDPACSTCKGSGKILGGDEYHDCPGCRLTARYTTRWCDSCHTDQPIFGMETVKGEFGNRYAICASCLEASRVAHEASVEAQYREAYGPDFDKLATHQVEGR